MPEDWQTRVVGTRAGRSVVAVVLVVLGVWILGPNMPAGPVRERVDWIWRPAVEIGLAQDWAVFSPDPRNRSLDVYAVVEFDDGSTERWDVPEFDPVVGAYRQYRWHKWQDRVRLDARSDLWEPTGAWIAEQHQRDGELPASVRMFRRWRVQEPLDDDGARTGDWQEFEFHVWERDR